MMMHSKERGFTLIEMMITMGMALFIMAGMTSVFVSQTRTATMLKNKTEAMGDLFLASQIMQRELRSSKAICLNSTATNLILMYQPSDSNVPIVSCALPVSPYNGLFRYNNTGALCWDRPKKNDKCQELIRGLSLAGGLQVTKTTAVPPLPDMYEVTLTSKMRGLNNQVSLLPLTFKVWARNQ